MPLEIVEYYPEENFKPFERLTSLPPIPGPLKAFGDDLIDFPFRFQGITGKFKLITIPMDNDRANTPLGETRLVMSYYNNVPRIEEIPLGIALSFRITNIDQFDELGGYLTKFNLGGKPYFLETNGNDSENMVMDSIEQSGWMDTFSCDLHSRSKIRGTVVLPYSLDKITAIEARFIKRGSNN